MSENILLKYYSQYLNPGIYCLYNLYNNKYYIGSSNKLSKRVWEHFYHLKNKTHYNNHLQYSFDKYEKYFIGFVLEDVENLDELLVREQYWIDRLEAYNPEIGYNQAHTVNGSTGYKHTKESKLKMSKAKQGKNHYNFGKHLSETIRERISKGNTGKIRSEETKQKLRDANLGKTKSEESKRKVSKTMRNKKWTTEQLKRMGSGKAKKVYQYDVNLNLINTFNSGADASRELNLGRSYITNASKNGKKYKGFIWSYTPL